MAITFHRCPEGCLKHSGSGPHGLKFDRYRIHPIQIPHGLRFMVSKSGVVLGAVASHPLSRSAGVWVHGRGLACKRFSMALFGLGGQRAY